MSPLRVETCLCPGGDKQEWPEKSCDIKGQDTPILGHAWPSLSFWP